MGRGAKGCIHGLNAIGGTEVSRFWLMTSLSTPDYQLWSDLSGYSSFNVFSVADRNSKEAIAKGVKLNLQGGGTSCLLSL